MKVLKIICVAGFGFCALYLLLPSSSFPPPPPNTLISSEPADTESIHRQAYYSNYSRAEIMDYYKRAFLPTPQLRLNYPPEDSGTYIRDLTQSSWMEELVHPGRDSIYINGFYPTKPTEQINIGGVRYQNKIIVRQIPTTAFSRLTTLSFAAIAIYLISKEYAKI